MTLKTTQHPKTSDQYVRSMGLVCPNCESEHILPTIPMEHDAGVAWSELACRDCQAQWTETYGLVGYLNLRLAGNTKTP